MIPAKWYVIFMTGAGIVMLLYGLGTASGRTILGSFLFLGLGGAVYFNTRKKY